MSPNKSADKNTACGTLIILRIFPNTMPLKIEYAVLFDRPTKQKTEDGFKDWVNMFDKAPFEGMDEALKDEIIEEAEAESKEKLYHDGSWYIDYVRIRFRAVKY